MPNKAPMAAAHRPALGSYTLEEFSADLLAYEGIKVDLSLVRGMTAKRAIRCLYTQQFHTHLGATAPVRQLSARLAECLNLEAVTYTVLTKSGYRARSTDPLQSLCRELSFPCKDTV